MGKDKHRIELKAMTDQSAKAKQIFEILMREHAAMLMTYLRTIVKSSAAVEDLFQETMLTAWHRMATFDTTRPFGPWLRGIAKNHALAYFRRYRHETLMENESVLDYLAQQLEHIEQQPGDSWKEKYQALQQCIDKLPENYQTVVKLRYLEDQKTAQVQQQTQLAKETLKKRLQRAKRKLLDCLASKGVLTLEGVPHD